MNCTSFHYCPNCQFRENCEYLAEYMHEQIKKAEAVLKSDKYTITFHISFYRSFSKQYWKKYYSLHHTTHNIFFTENYVRTWKLLKNGGLKKL